VQQVLRGLKSPEQALALSEFGGKAFEQVMTGKPSKNLHPEAPSDPNDVMGMRVAEDQYNTPKGKRQLNLRIAYYTLSMELRGRSGRQLHLSRPRSKP